jgi:hypothetical protein
LDFHGLALRASDCRFWIKETGMNARFFNPKSKFAPRETHHAPSKSKIASGGR